MSVKALSDYTLYAKYSRYLPEKKRRETWDETVDRVFEMHQKHLGDKYENIKDEFAFTKEMVKKKRVLGSQRALQFGGDPILKKQAKLYNCTVSYVDRPKFFSESMYLLLCGCGVGFSVQKHHVAKLPNIIKRDKGEKLFVIPDTIEGWADAIGVLMSSYFDVDTPYYSYDYQSELDTYAGYKINFDYSLIRKKGSKISWGGKAPGPDGLKKSIDNIEKVIDNLLLISNKLRPIDAYDVIMHTADAVISGGLRRSATISIFSPDDTEMATSKTGDWFIKNPQRGRSNNSALLVRNETTRELFSSLMKSVKEYGEPGFVWAENTETLYNPCVEVGMRAYTEDGRSGFQFCNLTEINGRKMKTREDFLDACKASAILGTIQASYHTFDYLSKESEEIVKREALLGCSITGIMDHPEITLDPTNQKDGAKLILDVNLDIAKKIGINKCARATAVKPAGSTSCILGTASGIHPHHSKRYIRRVQANKLEFPVSHFKKFNPSAVEESVWSTNNTDYVLSFLCEVPEGARTKNQVSAVDLLKNVMSTQQNWIEYGTRHDAQVVPWLRHNVSNTITVRPEEWDIVEDFIYENRKWFAGISLLPSSGDLDYPQAPFTTVLTEKEIVNEFGEGALFASGLIVDGLAAFNNNLWAACDSAIGIGENVEKPVDIQEPILPLKNGYTDKVYAEKLTQYSSNLKIFYEQRDINEVRSKKLDWIRRFDQFAVRYVNGNKRKCSHMLKHVHNWKLWLDLKREYKDINWADVVEEDYSIDVSGISGEACSGGKCTAGDLGASIESKKYENKKD